MIAKLKLERTLSTILQNKDQTQNPTNNESNNKQGINNNGTTALEWTASEAIDDLDAFYWLKLSLQQIQQNNSVKRILQK